MQIFEIFDRKKRFENIARNILREFYAVGYFDPLWDSSSTNIQ